MEPLNVNSGDRPFFAPSQNVPEKFEPVLTVAPPIVDMAKKEPFHFLLAVQKQVMQAKGTEITRDNFEYPQETRALWVNLEKAVRSDNREQAESLRKQLLPNSGAVIEAKLKPIDNPKTDSEKVQNIYIDISNQASISIPAKLLCAGLQDNCLPLIYLSLTCGARPEVLYRNYRGEEHHFLKIALEAPTLCDMVVIRLLFQFAQSRTDLANGTLLTNPKSNFPFSPLKKAFEMGRADVVRELLAHGAKPEIAWGREMRVEQLFLYAINEGHSEIVQLFLGAGFLVNYQDQKGNTALHYAKLRKNDALIKDLLIAGADPNLPNSKGQNYLQFAEEGWKFYDKASREKLIPAFTSGDFKKVDIAGGIKKVASRLLDINEPMDEQENTLLHLAMLRIVTFQDDIPGIERARVLIQIGAAVGQKNKGGETPRTIIQKAKAAQEKRIEAILQNAPLDEEGTTFLEQTLQEAIRKATKPNEAADYVSTPPLVPMMRKNFTKEQEYLIKLQAFDQFLEKL